MASILLEPAITGPMLLALTTGPASIRDNVERYAREWNIGGMTAGILTVARLITALKWLTALGLVSRVNHLFNAYARNHWRWSRQGRAWEFGVERREVAVVTGGCSGFGLLIAKGLAPQATVVVLDISECPPELRNVRGVTYYKCDITKKSEVSETAARIRRSHGPPSILVNNAGIAHSHTIMDTNEEWLEKLFRVNLFSHYLLIQEFLPAMLSNRKGHIVAIASMASYLSGCNIVDYCATKAGVLALHEGLNQELKWRHGEAGRCINTSIVHPMWARTKIIESWEASMALAKTVILPPEAIAGPVVEQILSGQSGQIYCPPSAVQITGVRGFPTWLQEIIRDGVQSATAVIKEKSDASREVPI